MTNTVAGGMTALPVSEIFLHPDRRSRLATHVWRSDETRQYYLSFDRRLAAGTGRAGAHVHLDFAYRFARTFGRALAAGAVTDQHELPWLHLMVVLRAARAETYAVGPPRLIQKYIAIPLAAWIGRRTFGYQVVWR